MSMIFINRTTGTHKVGNMMYNFHTTPDTGIVITDTFIKQQARTLKELGGKKSIDEYVLILTPYKNNNLKFDRMFDSLRDEIFKMYK